MAVGNRWPITEAWDDGVFERRVYGRRLPRADQSVSDHIVSSRAL
jgi:hypothetical protein